MGSKLKNICIVYRPHSDKAYKVAVEVAEWLKQNKVRVYLDPGLKAIPHTIKVKKTDIKNLDLVEYILHSTCNWYVDYLENIFDV